LALAPPEMETEATWMYGLTRGIRLRPDAWHRLNKADSDVQAPGADQPIYGRTDKRAYRPGWQADPDQRAVPRWILFPEITDRPQSRLVRIGASKALGQLLGQMHPPAVLPEAVAAAQLDAAAEVIRQGECYHLQAGRDLYDDPGRLARLLPTNTRAQPSPKITQSPS
jgi:hypothetical protein